MSSPVPDRIASAAASAAWTVALLLFFGTWLVEGFVWLRTAPWPGWSIGDLGPTPRYRWLGFQKIVDWLVTLPIGLLYAVVGAMLTGWAVRYGFRVKRWWTD